MNHAAIHKETPVIMDSESTGWKILEFLKDYRELILLVGVAIIGFLRRAPAKLKALKELTNTARLLGALEKTVRQRMEQQEERDTYILSRLNAQTDASATATFRANVKGECIYVNNAYSDLFGRDEPEELLGDGWLSIIHREEQDRVIKLWERVVRSKTGTTIFFDAYTATGRQKVKATIHVHKNSKGKFVEILGTIQLHKSKGEN